MIVRVPTGRVVHAVTGGNWEGTEIAPDHPCPVTDALDVAHRLALETVRDRLVPEATNAGLPAEVARGLSSRTPAQSPERSRPSDGAAT